MAKEKPFRMMTLGRVFYLGMLYDIRSDKTILGVTLWDPEVLANNSIKRKQPYTNFEIIAEDSFEKRAHALGVQASLKLSLLAGLISVQGSAKYAEDYQETHHATRLTLKYSTTTHMETLSMKHLSKGVLNHPNLHDINLATHVVTGIVYGAEAFFIFDHTISSGESKKEISGSLRAIFEKPLFKTDGEANLNLSDHEKRLVDKLHCKFYGDFHLKENPNTFIEAVKIYRQLPSLLGENMENAVPKQVWLHPLHLLDDKAARIVRDISSNLIEYSITAIEKLHTLEVRALDLSKTTALTYFGYMKQHLLDFVERLQEIRRDLKEGIALNLPKIRGNIDTGESVLFDLFKQIDSSPFNRRTLELWLEEKRKTIELITSWVGNLAQSKSLNILHESSSPSAVIGDTRYDYIVCLSFRFVRENDPQLSDMYDYRYYKNSFNSSKIHQEWSKWFQDRRIIANIRKKVQQFIDFAKANVENEKLKLIVDEEYLVDDVENAELILYHDGSEQKGFQIPSKPDTPYLNNATHNTVTLEWTHKAGRKEEVNKYKVMYQKHKAAIVVSQNNSVEEQKWIELWTENNHKTITITGLSSNTEFVFKVQAITPIGLSPTSDLTEPIITLAKEQRKIGELFYILRG